MKKAICHDSHGITQFELTKNTLNNLQQFKVSPAAKLVLLYLTGCYNPLKADVFPKQKTIALALGISQRSVIRAVQELVNEGLILVAQSRTNSYKFTSKIVSDTSQNLKKFTSDNLSRTECKNVTFKDDNLSSPCINKKQEQIKNNLTIDSSDFKLLERYAKSKNAKNPKYYALKLINNGDHENILKEIKTAEKKAQAFKRETNDFLMQKSKWAQTAENPYEWNKEKALSFVKALNPIFHSSGIAKNLIEKFGFVL